MEKNEMEFKIHMGSLAPKLSVQLTKQGLKFNKDAINHMDELSSYISHLYFSDIITSSIAEKARLKLYNKIRSHVKKLNKPL